MRTIKNYPNYSVTEAGDVLTSGLVLNKALSEKGFHLVCLSNDLGPTWFYVHKLVMDAFFGFSQSKIRHINGDKTDNRLVNLEYFT